MTSPTPSTPSSVRALRISRLLNGSRRDLESAEQAQAAGWMTAINGAPIDAEIQKLRNSVDAYSALLAEVSS
jgi:hypothetical protein